MNLLIIPYVICLVILAIFSYGFIDLNLHLSSNSLFTSLQNPLSSLVFQQRPIAAALLLCILAGLFVGYYFFLTKSDKVFKTWKSLLQFLLAIGLLLSLSFPALTYDLFNYMTTAKLTYFYRENPYVTMPIEIPNEPYLAFTRASNKVALYGPIWILLTALPHFVGGGNIWVTIFMFKLMNVGVFLLYSYGIYRVTKSIKNVIFFALNPLVLIEILVSGHNDLFMMLFALGSLLVWKKSGMKNKIVSIIAMACSILVKSATVGLLPLFFIKKVSREQLLVLAYWCMALVFFIAAPLREELYPWYAVWLISIASMLPYERHTIMRNFTIVLSFALELRHIPYVYMGYYGGPGPLLRILLTALPLVVYIVWEFTRRKEVWHIKRA